MSGDAGPALGVDAIQARLDALLRSMRTVAAFSMWAERGRIRINIDPDFEALRDLHRRRYDELKLRRSRRWARVFDAFGRNGGETPTDRFESWISSYTGRRLPDVQMQVWLDTTLDRISQSHPRRILEIGCGTGLLLEQLAQRSTRYVGLDISGNSLSHLRARLAALLRANPQIEVYQSGADTLAALPAGKFDIVILNSVVQYFPDLGYLRDVIQGLEPLLDVRASIFIGDVRHAALLRPFKTSVVMARSPRDERAGDLRQRIAMEMAAEPELVIDPQFFHQLAGDETWIADVQVMLKRGDFANELSKYRYDVMLCTGAAEAATSDWTESRFGDAGAARLTELLAQRGGNYVLRGVRNSRIAGDLACMAALDAAPDDVVREDISWDESLPASDPESFWRLGERHGYRVAVAWGSDSSRLDVFFHSAQGTRLPAGQGTGADRRVKLSNEPFSKELCALLKDDLKRATANYPLDIEWTFQGLATRDF
jgi:SAM-dependent methyltransferase